MNWKFNKFKANKFMYSEMGLISFNDSRYGPLKTDIV